FTKLIKEITVAARMGGGEPDGNPRLRTAVAAAKQSGVPKDNIERGIKKGTGELEGESYDEVVYEGYGPAGVAMLIEGTTDNRNRTVADVRHLLSRYNGSLGQSNSVAWMFSTQGHIEFSATEYTEDQVTDASIEAGAEDIVKQEDVWLVVTGAEDFHGVREKLEAQGLTILSASLTRVPQNTVQLSGKDAETMLKLMDALDDHDDVQKVHANFEIASEEMERIGGG
ncbi:uncharacterized protein METZ01_LOCUS517591, partial [marine metagenome]